jgi:outer membrane protein assembly factor BamB
MPAASLRNVRLARTAVPLALVVSACFAACGAGGGDSSSTTGPAAVAGGGTSSGKTAPAKAAGARFDWTRFGFDAARYNAAPRGVGAAAVSKLSERRISLPGIVDSSPIYLKGVEAGGSRRDLLVMTTTYGRLVGLDAATGQVVWTFTPKGYGSVAGSAQVTTATPVADPSRRFVYSASPDGQIHKVGVSDGSEVTSGSWPTAITRDATHEKIGPALNIQGPDVLVATGGYIGDAPPYQGHVVSISRKTGAVDHVVNSLCSNRRRIIQPSSCPSSDSAIFGRGSPVVDPTTGRIYVATGNGPWNGSDDWGDSVLELSPRAKNLVRHFTPTNQAELESGDLDLGSASPALLPEGSRKPRFLLQGGKDDKLRLLSLRRSLFGVKGAAGKRLGGEVQTLPTPGGTTMFTAPAVLRTGRTTLVFVATDGGTSAYRLKGGRLHQVWSKDASGTSPVVAGGLVWVYDPNGELNVYRPASGKLVRSLPAPSGHWNSPIVDGGRVYLPSGDSNSHSTTGTLSIYEP